MSESFGYAWRQVRLRIVLTWHRAMRHVGRRGAFLAFLALLDYSIAFSLWPAQVPRHVTLVLPPHVWAIAWLVAALGCTVGIFLRRDRVPYTMGTAIKSVWSALYFHLWLVQHYPDAWLSAMIWLMFALIVLMVSSWPDPILVEAVKDRRELMSLWAGRLYFRSCLGCSRLAFPRSRFSMQHKLTGGKRRRKNLRLGLTRKALTLSRMTVPRDSMPK